MRRLRNIVQRLRRREDSEHEQALIRVVIVAILFGYVLIQAPRIAAAGMLVGLGASYLGIALIIAILIVISPAPSPPRRVGAMIADFAVLSGFMHYGGEGAAPFYPVYLWIAFGNGFRYGLPYLAASVVLASIGFLAVILTTAFWRAEWPLAIGLLAALICLPGYAASLIRNLTEAKAQAEAASEAKTRFLAGVSHELRTPLNAIIGTSELMGDTPLDTDQREMVQTVRTAGTTLLALIDDILDVSRIEADRTTVADSDFDLHAVLADVLTIFRPTASDKGLRLFATIDPELSWWLRGDAKHLRQIVTNLVGNAVKFTETGEIELIARLVHADKGLARADAGATIRIAVRDSGIGIPAHQHERIFERFARGDDAVNRRFGGTGLGLAISRSLAELSGGTLTVHSAPGQGSTFTLELPHRAAREPQPGADSGAQRALLVSDDEDLLAQLRQRLALDGIEVAIARPAALAPDGTGLGLPAFSPEGVPLVMIDLRCGQSMDCGPVLTTGWRFGAGMLVFIVEPGAAGAHGPDAAVAASTSDAVGTDAVCQATLAWPASDTALRGVLHAAGHFARAPAPTHGPGEPGAGTRSAGAGAGAGMRVLVAEDNPVNRKVVARILARAGFDARLVESGEDALDALTEARYDAVLLDINMPGLSGLDVVKLYRMAALDQPHTPILALSADATVETRDAALAAGIDVYLTKPVEPARLIAEIETLVGALPAPRAELPPAPAEPAPTKPAPTKPAPTKPAPAKPTMPDQEPVAAGDAGDHAPVLDRAALASLSAFSNPDEDFVSAILREFLVNTDHLLTEALDAARAGDASRFRGAIHALRGTAGNVGAEALRRFCQELQGMSSERLQAHGDEYIARLEHECARLRRDIGRY